MANIGSIYAASSEHIGGTDGPSILFSTPASFLAAAALSLTFITSILAPAIARKGGERERERGKQNTFCQIDVDHLSYLSAMAEGARQRQKQRWGRGWDLGEAGETSPKGFLSLSFSSVLEYLIQPLEIL